MTEEYYEVLYEPEYGTGLRFPEDFVHKVFELYPPESEVGKDLWTKTYDCILQEGDEVPEGRKYYYRIVETKEFFHGYVWLKLQDKKDIIRESYSKYCTKDFKSYYYVSSYNTHYWRDRKEIISLVKEMELDIPIQKVPIGYDYYVREYDGSETVIIECPTRRIIEDLLGIIAKKEQSIHPLTQKLLDGESLFAVINPDMKKLNLDDEDTR